MIERHGGTVDSLSGELGDRDLRARGAARGRRAARRAGRRRAPRRRRRRSASTPARCSSAPGARRGVRDRRGRGVAAALAAARRAAARRCSARALTGSWDGRAGGAAGRRRVAARGARRARRRSRSRPPTTAFVGRERELAQLRDALAAARREQAVRLLAVVGPPGIGKSRLAHEASGDARRAIVVSGRCLSYGEGIAYRPLAEIVAAARGRRAGCSPATSRPT